MAVIDTEPRYADVIGLPIFHVDAAVTEHLGDGIMSVINYRTRNGLLVPQFEVVISATKLILAGEAVAECARAIFQPMVIGARH